jgi:hypothetical protein
MYRHGLLRGYDLTVVEKRRLSARANRSVLAGEVSQPKRISELGVDLAMLMKTGKL